MFSILKAAPCAVITEEPEAKLRDAVATFQASVRGAATYQKPAPAATEGAIALPKTTSGQAAPGIRRPAARLRPTTGWQRGVSAAMPK